MPMGGHLVHAGPGANGGGVMTNNGVAHPLSSANPPGLPRPPLHPAVSHSHGHSHLIAPPGSGGQTLQLNGGPMQRLANPGMSHHGGHGPAPPPPTHISNPPTSSSHPMSSLSTGTSTVGSSSHVGAGPQQHQPSQSSLVSNGGLNGHANTNMGTQLFGDTEPENEKWWWVCCLEFCFCLL